MSSSPSAPAMLPHELVAYLVLSSHASFPPSFKPSPTPSGPTWTPLAGIVLLPPPPSSSQLQPLVVSTATGSKVLPDARRSAHGDVLHDMHAEVLAVRGLRRWLWEEVGRAEGGLGAGWLERREEGGKWKLKDGVEVWMYASDVPCGEASTAYLARQQLLHDPAMAALHAATSNGVSPARPVDSGAGPTRGRASYALARVLRTKPGRPDSPHASSLSCADKIAQWNALGVQGALLAGVLGRVGLKGVVLGPVGGEEGEEERVVQEAREALSERVVRELEREEVKARLPSSYSHPQPLQVDLSPLTFPFSRLSLPSSPAPTPSPFCTLLIASSTQSLGKAPAPKPEKLAAGGFRLGAGKRKGDVPLAHSARSTVCKAEMGALGVRMLEKTGLDGLRNRSYKSLKSLSSSPSPAILASPPTKRRKLDPAASPPADTLSAPAPFANNVPEGTREYQAAKRALRVTGGLFESWPSADARWESFTL